MTVSRTRFLTAAAATMLTVLLTSPGSAQVARFDSDLSLGTQAVSNVRSYGYRGGYRVGYRGYGYRRYGYRGYGYRGAAVGAGVAGLAAGAAVGGAIAAQGASGYYGGTQVTDADAYYCRGRFSNYDPATRLGLSNDGIWYFCPSGVRSATP
jgi:hypothetical protein